MTHPSASDLAIPPSLGRRVLGGFGWSILGGAALGALAWLTDQLGFPYSLLPANAIGAWLGVAFVLGASARTIPTGALRGLIGLLTAVAAYYVLFAVFGRGLPGHRRIPRRHDLGRGRPPRRPGPGRRGRGLALRARAGRGPIGVALLAAALFAEGVVFGARRARPARSGLTDPGASPVAAEIVIGLALPCVLLRRGERLRGYLARWRLAVVAALVIGPVTTVIRGLADTF